MYVWTKREGINVPMNWNKHLHIPYIYIYIYIYIHTKGQQRGAGMFLLCKLDSFNMLLNKQPSCQF